MALKRGPRPKKPADRLTERITLNFTPGEYRDLRRLSRAHGEERPSDYVRDLIYRKLESFKKRGKR